MPSFNVPVKDVEFEFEVYCKTCGEGLCNESEVTETYTRRMSNIRVNVCPECMKKKDDEIADKEKDIERLEARVIELCDRIADLERTTI